MSLRRIGLAAPLAFLVAVFAHLAGFGAGHTPGAGHAHQLLGALGAALGLIALATILLAALRLDRRDEAPSRQAFWLAVVLAAGGTAAFGAIELAEGHAPFGGSVRALAAILPAATLVAHLSGIVARMLRRTGEALAAMVPPRHRSLGGFPTIRALRAVAPRGADSRGSAQERAPPIPV